MGARTDAARAEVVAARGGLVDEVVRLEASGRAAVDLPAHVRRAPAKAAGAAAGAAFLLLGGPGRVVRGVRRAVRGPQADLPKSLLPNEVERTLRKLGSDGDRVRGALERDFARYLDEKAPERGDRDLGAVAAVLLSNIAKPVTAKAGRELAARLFRADGPGFDAALEQARARMAATVARSKGEPIANAEAGAADRDRDRVSKRSDSVSSSAD